MIPYKIIREQQWFLNWCRVWVQARIPRAILSSRLAQHYPKMPSSTILREDISEFSVQAGSHLSLQKLPLTGSPRCLSYLVGGSFSSFDTFVEYAVKTLGANMKQLWETRNIPRSFFSQAQLVQAWTPKRHRVPAGGAHRQDPHDLDDPHYPLRY